MSGRPVDNRPVQRDDRLPVVLPGAGPEHDRAPAERHPRWLNLTSQRQVRSLACGPDSAVWLATGGGILRWWPEMKRYTRYASEHGLPGNATVAVAVDEAEQVWAVGDTGQLHFLDNNENCWLLYDYLRDSAISCLSIDNAGHLWAAGADGVWNIDHPSMAPHQLPSMTEASLAVAPPRALAVVNGDVWVVNARGVYHYDGARWEAPRDIPGVLTLLRQENDLWLGTLRGLRRVDLEAGALVPNEPWPQGTVTALAASDDGVWAAIDATVGVARAADWHPIPGQVHTSITGLASADSDGVWIGTHDGLLHGGPEGMQPQETGAPPDDIVAFGAEGRSDTFSNMVQAVTVQRENERLLVWIGTARGLFRLDPANDVWRAFTQPGLQDVRALALSTFDEELWAASWDGGLQRLPGGIASSNVPLPILYLTTGSASDRWAVACLDAEPNWKQNTTRPDGVYRSTGGDWSLVLSGSVLRAAGLPAGGRVQAVVPATNGNLWIGTSFGLWSYDPATQTPPEAADQTVRSAEIRTLLALPPPLDVLCVGTTQGLFSGYPGNLLPVVDLEGRAITALAWDDRAARLWVGTETGLAQLQRTDDGWQIGQHFTGATSGLAADRVTALALTSRGTETQVWIGTPSGLSCYCDRL